MKKSLVILIHAGYWLLYLLLLVMLVQALQMDRPLKPEMRITSFYSPAGLLAVLPNVLAFYGCYFWVFSKFLKRQKLFLTFLGIIAACLVSVNLSAAMLYALFPESRGVFYNAQEYMGFNIGFSSIALIHGIIALVIKGFVSWYNEIKIKEDLAKKNFEMELALVKSQLDPHFLFNTINNIDVLISKDAVKASLYLNKLSDIMRFMLYETKTDTIPLEQELAYIEKYIDLQRIRTSNPNYVQFVINGEPQGRRIAPMIFIPFVENALKHTNTKWADKAINIQIDILKNKIVFHCSNKYSPKHLAEKTPGGLGNELIQKRLQLLYQHQYSLSIDNNDDLYRVHLELFVNEN